MTFAWSEAFQENDNMIIKLLDHARLMTEEELLALSDEEFNEIMEAAIEEAGRSSRTGAEAFEELEKESI